MSGSAFMKYTEPNIIYIVNLTSLISSITSLVLICFLIYFRSFIINRVSLRFQGLIALFDIGRHIVLTGMKSKTESTCIAISFFSFFFDHMYVFINVILALNIQILFFHRVRPRKWHELFSLTITILFASIIDLIPLTSDIYGPNHNGFCFLKPDPFRRKLYKIFSIYATLIPGLIYCLLIFVSVTISLYNNRMINAKFPNKKIIIFDEIINANSFFKKLQIRMAFYVLSTFLCLFPYITSNLMYDIFGYYSDWLDFLCHIGSCITGTVNLISLLFDPLFQLTIQNVKKYGLFSSHVSSKEFQADIDLKTINALKENSDYLIEFPSGESMELIEFLKYT